MVTMLDPNSSIPKQEKTSGRLQIGDQWNAIRIIAQSQTHPLKAVCELVENAIDAGAKNIEIVRRRTNDQIMLEVGDDGHGVRLDQNGRPHFEHIATHVCDSMKRRLSRPERVGVHGEFGIGLLSFWSLGEQLRMIASDDQGRLHEMILDRGERSYSVSPLRRMFAPGGTQIIVGPLLKSTRNILTGEKLRRYLSAELRDRIRASGVRIQISDRISRKQLVVIPREFQGERLDELKSISTSFGKLIVELYLRPTADNRQETRVALCKDGTRVLRDITELIQFDRAPWTDGRLEGILDFPAFDLAPGTRNGVVPNERLEMFIEAVYRIEPAVNEAIAQRDQAESAKANGQILRQVKRAFLAALRELPEDQYLFFDVPHSARRSRNRVAINGGAATQKSVARKKKETISVASSFRPSQLDNVVITPRHARRQPDGECVLRAQAYDCHREELTDRVKYHWSIVEGEGRISAIEGRQCTVTTREPDLIVVEVKADKGIQSAIDRVAVKFVANEDDYGSTRGLPSYRLQTEPGHAWRSRYDVKKNDIVINSAHRDFLASRTTMAKHRRYIGKLYAKEVVLLNFPHESSGEAMERLIEVIMRTEDAL